MLNPFHLFIPNPHTTSKMPETHRYPLRGRTTDTQTRSTCTARSRSASPAKYDAPSPSRLRSTIPPHPDDISDDGSAYESDSSSICPDIQYTGTRLDPPFTSFSQAPPQWTSFDSQPTLRRNGVPVRFGNLERLYEELHDDDDYSDTESECSTESIPLDDEELEPMEDWFDPDLDVMAMWYWNHFKWYTEEELLQYVSPMNSLALRIIFLSGFPQLAEDPDFNDDWEGEEEWGSGESFWT
ncbi:hypothetical protein BJ508DRAFT_374527 [Ascobolus immersus RN42]|uniref:Uncharacterized protein n=1 Tax=Ascobolus immersus RN42 TaxID=1160509 RepID=A0A3N4IRN6_ASCIM|nr:hypothetical protein BJ508DRAFT_374527 [Ascobolus immersus RN42]